MNEEKRVCSECGAEIKENQKFCENCGAPVSPVKSESVNEVQPENNNTVRCPGCGAVLKTNEKRCYACGYVLNTNKTDYINNEFVMPENEVYIPEGYSPTMPVWKYLLYMIGFSIPVIGLILLIITAIDGSDRNKANFARAYLLLMVIVVVLAIIAFIVLFLGMLVSAFSTPWFEGRPDTAMAALIHLMHI